MTPMTPIEMIPDNEPLPPLDAATKTETFAASLPDDAETYLGKPPASSTDFGEPLTDQPELFEARKKRVKMSKKMQKMMDGFRDQIVDIPLMWFHNQAKDNPEWGLDDKEEEFLKDAFGVVFEVLDIQIEIEAVSMTLTSMWWVIAYPFAAFAFLFLTHKAAVTEKNREDQQ
jgi:hypothetical protein